MGTLSFLKPRYEEALLKLQFGTVVLAVKQGISRRCEEPDGLHDWFVGSFLCLGTLFPSGCELGWTLN